MSDDRLECQVPTRRGDGPVQPCGQPITDNAALCRDCTRRLRGTVAQLPAIADDLLVVVTRQAQTGQHVGKSGSDEQPLPYDVRTADALGMLERTVGVWVEYVAREQHIPGPTTAARLPSQRTGGTDADPSLAAASLGPLAVACAWLLRQVAWARRQDWAPELADAMAVIARQGRQVADLPPDLLYVGACDGNGSIDDTDGCARAVYARQGAAEAKCAGCHAVYPTTKRRAYLLALLDDQVANAATVGRALTGLGQQVNEATIRQWKSRGRLGQAIDAAGNLLSDRSGRPLYRIGDVRALIDEVLVPEPRATEDEIVGLG